MIEAAGEKPCVSIGAVKAIRRHHGEPNLVERMARFEGFIDQQTVGFVWGQTDCALLLADWAIACGHSDPAPHLRGQYDTEDGCRAILAAAGGLPNVVQACAASIGLKPLHEPEFGAVAVIGSATNSARQWGAIWQGHKWLVRWLAKDGRPTWALFAAKPLSLWRV
ncbi:DUF6950 family protein [Devosia soli]|nr:hypothetical protein [Devosia soli]